MSQFSWHEKQRGHMAIAQWRTQQPLSSSDPIETHVRFEAESQHVALALAFDEDASRGSISFCCCLLLCFLQSRASGTSAKCSALSDNQCATYSGTAPSLRNLQAANVQQKEQAVVSRSGCAGAAPSGAGSGRRLPSGHLQFMHQSSRQTEITCFHFLLVQKQHWRVREPANQLRRERTS